MRAPTASSEPIPLLVPDLPSAIEVLPFLQRIDAVRWYSNGGPLVRELEALLARLTRLHVPGADGLPHLEAAAVANGTASIELALQAMGVGRGARVLLPAFTFPATATAVVARGAVPVLADVDARQWTLTPALARETLRHVRVDAVLPVASFGMPVDADAWDAFTAETGLPVLVDAAAAFGAQRPGRTTHVSCSLHATKPFGIGEGGVVLTADAALAARVRRLANFGFAEGVITESGGNAKLSEYHAAVGLAQGQRFELMRAKRAHVAGRYLAVLAAMSDLVELPLAPDGTIRSAMPVRLRTPIDAGAMGARLAAVQVQTRRWYFPAVHAHPAFASAERAGPDGGTVLPATEALGPMLLGLPFHAFLGDAQVARVCGLLREAVPEARASRRPLRSMRARWRVA